MKKPVNSRKQFQVKIQKLVYGGAGLARHAGKVVFVPFSVPGDKLLVRPIKEKKTFIQAEIIKIIEAGRGRTDPHCRHFTQCGGSHWQQLEYSHQVQAKRQILEEIFHHRFPETRDLAIALRASAQPYGYRSRARIQLRGSGTRSRIGFYRLGSHSVIDVKECPLLKPQLNEALAALRRYKIKVDAEARPEEIDVACSEEEGTWATSRQGDEAGEEICRLFAAGRNEDAILLRKIGEFRYYVSPSVFFQANDFIVPELVDLVTDAARSSARDCALDLFAGVGLFSLPLARLFRRVIAIDSSPLASRLCAANAKNAGFSNIDTVCDDVFRWLESSNSLCSHRCNLVVLDPPRTGAGPAIMNQILRWTPQTIIYVSCDPQTLVRDLLGIVPDAYAITMVEGLDMFPQTYHFETVVKLEKK